MELLQARILIDRCEAAARLQLAALRPLNVRDFSLLANQRLGRLRPEHNHLIIDIPIVRDDTLRDQRFRRQLLS